MLLNQVEAEAKKSEVGKAVAPALCAFSPPPFGI